MLMFPYKFMLALLPLALRNLGMKARAPASSMAPAYALQC